MLCRTSFSDQTRIIIVLRKLLITRMLLGDCHMYYTQLAFYYA